jgi:hypothetical protein
VFVHRLPCAAADVGGPVSTGLLQLQQPLASLASLSFATITTSASASTKS